MIVGGAVAALGAAIARFGAQWVAGTNARP